MRISLLAVCALGDVAFLDYGRMVQIDDTSDEIVVGSGAAAVGLDALATKSMLPGVLASAGMYCTAEDVSCTSDEYANVNAEFPINSTSSLNITHLMAIVGGATSRTGFQNSVHFIPYPQARIRFLHHTSGIQFDSLPRLSSWTERSLTGNLDASSTVQVGVASDSFTSEIPSESPSATLKVISIPGRGLDPVPNPRTNETQSWQSMWTCLGQRFPFGSADCEWDEVLKADMIWSPRRHAATVFFDEKLWVIGGEVLEYGETKYRSDVWSSVNGGHWNLSNPGCDRFQDYYSPTFFTHCYGKANFTIPRVQTCECETFSPRALHVALTDGDRLYVLGGRLGLNSTMFNNSKGYYQEERCTRENGWFWDRDAQGGPMWTRTVNASVEQSIEVILVATHV
jgi:hypothetical protein